METPLLLVAAVIIAGLVFVVLPVVGLAYEDFRHKKIITCPDTRDPAEVGLKASWAALMAALGKRHIPRVKSCGLWPDKKGCAEACVKENWPTS